VRVANVVLSVVCVAQKHGQDSMAPGWVHSAIGHQCASHGVVVVVVAHVQGHESSWSSAQFCNWHQNGSHVTVAVELVVMGPDVV
jgi:hypothetical protein